MLKTLRVYINTAEKIEDVVDNVKGKFYSISQDDFFDMHQNANNLKTKIMNYILEVQKKIKIIGIAPGVANEYLNINYLRCRLELLEEATNTFKKKYQNTEILFFNNIFELELFDQENSSEEEIQEENEEQNENPHIVNSIIYL